MIDTHVHFWKFNPQRDQWITEEMHAIRRDFLPSDLVPLLHSNHVDGVVAVQADQSLEETDFLLSLAKTHPEILGVIGWLDLLKTDISATLDQYKHHTKLKGWRHIAQAEPKGFLNRPEFIENVKLLGQQDYTYGILVYHHQLAEAIDFVKQLPRQTLVLNHLGKPDLKTKDLNSWEAKLKIMGQHEHLYCKLSGLVTEAASGNWTADLLYRCLDTALESFGSKRVMFGSDWPVMLLNSNYTEWATLFKTYIDQLSPDEQADILQRNAITCYNLNL